MITAANPSLLAGDSEATWLFWVTDGALNEYHWSTKPYTYDGDAYTAAVIPEEWNGVDWVRNKSEMGIIAPIDVSFAVDNTAGALSAAIFTSDWWVRISEVLKAGVVEEHLRSWIFKLTGPPVAQYGKLVFSAQDWLQSHLDRKWPNTPLISDIFRDDTRNDEDEERNNLCVPVIYGTAYIPLCAVWDAGAGERRWLLGKKRAATFTVNLVHTPTEWPASGEWTPGDTTFTQYDSVYGGVTYRLLGNGLVAGANGFWEQNGRIPMMPCQFSRSDTVSKASGPDIIEYMLTDTEEGCGVLPTFLNAASFAAAKAVFAAYSPALKIEAGWWYQVPLREALAKVLTACNSELYYDRDGLLAWRIRSKTSVKTIAKGNVLRGSFSSQPLRKIEADSGYVAYADHAKPQDQMLKTLVATIAATDLPDGVLELPFSLGTTAANTVINAKKAAILHFQLQQLALGESSFRSDLSLGELEPADVITLDAAYGGLAVMVDRIHFGQKAEMAFTCTRYAQRDDWGDLSPGSDTVASPGTINTWRPVTSGPDQDTQNVLYGRLRIDTGTGAAGLGLNDKGLFVGDLASSTGMIMNHLGWGAYVGGVQSHVFALGPITWQGLSLTASDHIIGAYGSGQGVFWDQSAGALFVAGTIAAGKSLIFDTSASPAYITFSSAGQIFGDQYGQVVIKPVGATNTFAIGYADYNFAFTNIAGKHWVSFGIGADALHETEIVRVTNGGAYGAAGLDVKSGTLRQGGVLVSLAGHGHAGSDITSGTLGIGVSTAAQIQTSLAGGSAIYASAGGIRSDYASDAAFYAPSGGATLASLTVTSIKSSLTPSTKNSRALGIASLWYASAAIGVITCNDIGFNTATDYAANPLSDTFDDFALMRAVQPLKNSDGSLALTAKGEAIIDLTTYPDHLLVRDRSGKIVGVDVKSRLGFLEGTLRRVIAELDVFRAKLST